MKITIKEIAARVGGVVALSTQLGLSRGAVSQWEKVPIERVAAVAKLTGIPREEIRPDVFNTQPEHNPKEAA
jgi:DNA-binding transcriptional regulator YdaS (Cro superfamily)